ncbi:hypothetical protein B0J13DRAFT_572791 [Dactylonectria estremocensis]|uniref:Uncharacterized protein n=1 Tax=Dactylonectria estremocensis TaxID=1079267 RepID=A0A9P9D9L6_9HYPO|nr:hypothetical protein B0J13DRAFT_572791 [Dactylonectria estremocensis]
MAKLYHHHGFHVKLLGHVREKMLPYWHGWHQRDLSAQRLIQYHGSAIFTARKQPKSLNSIRFIYERSMGHYIRLLDEGNEMAGAAKKLLRKQNQQQQAEVVKGQGTQFQIPSILMAKHLSQAANDINDLTSLDESEVLKCPLSPKAIFKILNSHNLQVDNLDFSTKKELYSNISLLGNDSIITVPAVKQFKDALHIEDLSALPRADDSDDEDDNGPIQTPAPVSVTIKAAPE